MDIDRQRIAGVRALEALKYSYQDGEWLPSAATPPLPLTAEADAMHGALMLRERCSARTGKLSVEYPATSTTPPDSCLCRNSMRVSCRSSLPAILDTEKLARGALEWRSEPHRLPT
jgi:hypothetical protein